MINKIKILPLLLLLFVTVARAQSSNETFEEGNKFYSENEYSDAIAKYNDIIESGKESFELYYNLGNAYYKNGNLAKAIVNYHRALRLDPSNQDARYNLEITEAQTKNKINQVPEFILNSWIKSFRSSLSSNSWATISVLAFLAIFGAALAFLLATSVIQRKGWFSVAVAALVIFIFSTISAVRLRSEITDSSKAILLIGSVSVKSSPDTHGNDVFIINEGAALTIKDRLGEWIEIEIASGNRGWVKFEDVEVI